MDSSTKTKVISGLKWTSIESFITQLLGFIISIFLARRLNPSDYGILGMLSIFMAVSTTFTDSGFGSALIQKKRLTQKDCSTAFFFNTAVAIFFYLVLFFCAPFIAKFYNQPLLCDVTRIYTLTLIISGVNIVQNAQYSRDMNFRTKAKISIISLIFSGCVGLTMAYTGFGVWALVWQGLSSVIVRSALLWIWGSWIPSLEFSTSSFKALFGFGSKILGSSLINTIYNNLSTIIIGKAFQATDLGLYTRANSLATLPGGTILGIVMKVNYPVLARYQDDDEQLLSNYKILLRAPIFLLYPVLFGVAVLAYPLIYTLLGNKWVGCVPMLMILCSGYLWTPLTSINLNLLYVKGRTDLVLKLELIKKPIAFAMLFTAIPFGILGMCIAVALYEFVAFSFNCYYTGKILNYGWLQQLKEIVPILFYSIVMSLIVFVAVNWISVQPIKLAVGIVVGVISYFIIARLNHDSTLKSLLVRVADRFPQYSFFKKIAG